MMDFEDLAELLWDAYHEARKKSMRGQSDPIPWDEQHFYIRERWMMMADIVSEKLGIVVR